MFLANLGVPHWRTYKLLFIPFGVLPLIEGLCKRFIIPHYLPNTTKLSGVPSSQRTYLLLFYLVHCSLRFNQCDQMVRLISPYLAICNEEIQPNNVTNLPEYGSAFCQKRNKPFKICQTCNFLPKWLNLAKSGLTGFIARSR